MAKKIEAYEIINHGVEWPDYFQGCGVCYTEFTDVVTGIGNSEREAAEDAMEQLAQIDWDTDSNAELSAELLAASGHDDVSDHAPVEEDGDSGETPYVHVSIRVR